MFQTIFLFGQKKINFTILTSHSCTAELVLKLAIHDSIKIIEIRPVNSRIETLTFRSYLYRWIVEFRSMVLLKATFDLFFLIMVHSLVYKPNLAEMIVNYVFFMG